MSKLEKNYYKSIDELPCWNFDKINQTGNYSYLIIDSNYDCKENLQKVWENIYNEFIQNFGISENFKTYLQKLNLHVQQLNEAYNLGQRHKLTFAEITKRQADELIKQDDDNDISSYALVSKFMGFQINPKNISVKEFYGYLKLASKYKSSKNA